nr:hypothetical protein [Candidatus Nitrososphaera gargensis]
MLEQTLDGCRWMYNYFFDKNIYQKKMMQFLL